MPRAAATNRFPSLEMSKESIYDPQSQAMLGHG
jgi:hypothetical protein